MLCHPGEVWGREGREAVAELSEREDTEQKTEED